MSRKLPRKDCRYCHNEVKRRKAYYCDTFCQHNYIKCVYLLKWKLGVIKGAEKTPNYIRNYILEKYKNQCARCGWNQINPSTGKVPLEVEHIDGDFRNIKEDNLIALCPNCHSLTPTFRALNKGNGREKRRIKAN